MPGPYNNYALRFYAQHGALDISPPAFRKTSPFTSSARKARTRRSKQGKRRLQRRARGAKRKARQARPRRVMRDVVRYRPRVKNRMRRKTLRSAYRRKMVSYTTKSGRRRQRVSIALKRPFSGAFRDRAKRRRTDLNFLRPIRYEEN